MAFPYGIYHNDINKYISYIKQNDIVKTSNITNLNASVHPHLPYNHIRRLYPIFGINSGRKMSYEEYLYNTSKSHFMISTAGDRDDCYRHYECIGLNTIPISNINYVEIFEDNMIYSNATDMINMIETNTVNHIYKKPNKDILTIKYWIGKIYKRIEHIYLFKDFTQST
jgi:hypothetical protein